LKISISVEQANKMTFITHGFPVSVISDVHVRERVWDLASPFRFMLRKSSLVECVSVFQGTCLQCAEKIYIHQYVKPCEENPRYTFLTIKSSLRSHIIGIIVGSYLTLLTAFVELSFSSVGRAVAGNVRGPVIKSHQGHCIFQR
jgi:hypothetical protein